MLKKKKGKEDTANSNYDIFIEKIKNIKFVKSYIIRVMVETTKKIIKKNFEIVDVKYYQKEIKYKIIS